MTCDGNRRASGGRWLRARHASDDTYNSKGIEPGTIRWRTGVGSECPEIGRRGIAVKHPSPDIGAVRRVLWWVLLAVNGLMAGEMILAALAFHRPVLVLGATAPLLLVGGSALALWWDTCRPCREAMRRALRWAVVAADALLVAHAAAAWRLGGRFGLLVTSGPVLLAGLLTLILWRHSGDPRACSSGRSCPHVDLDLPHVGGGVERTAPRRQRGPR